MVKSARIERVAEQLRQVLSEILLYKVRDPDASGAVITRVVMSRDLGHARVYVSVLGTEEERERTIHALERASSFVRTELARAVRMRRVPELAFHPDSGMEHSARIHESLRELGFDGMSGSDQQASGSGPDVDSEPSAEQEDEVWRGDREPGGGE